MGENMIRKNVKNGAGVTLVISVLILSAIGVAGNTEYKVKVGNASINSSGILLSEGFEDGVMPPPDGWYTINSNPTYNWDIIDNATYPDYVHSGDYAGWVNYDSVSQSDEWLVSPDIDLTGLDEVLLVFWAESNTNWPGATVELHIRGEGFDDILWDMIQDESWDNFTYREMTFDLSNYVCQIINISWRYVGFDGNSFGLDDILVTSGPPEPNLCCEGSLSWTNISVGATVTESFQVCNCGEDGSLLDWQLQEEPSWGIWEIEPDSGNNLAAGDCVTINVTLIVPSDKNKEFDGIIKIINSDLPSDKCEIDVYLSTPKSRIFNFNLLELLFERFPNMFLILRQLLGI
jgi:hypothetical protein